MTEIKTGVIVEIIPTKIWIESDILGSKHVVLQHEGCEPFTYATFGYDYRYTSNSGTFAQAQKLARELGAVDPIEQKNKEFPKPTEAGVRQQIAMLKTLLPEWKSKAEWLYVTKAGQVNVGDKLKFKIGDREYRETAKQILHPGTDKEEVIYHMRENFYFITSMVISGFSNHKSVEVLEQVK